MPENNSDKNIFAKGLDAVLQFDRRLDEINAKAAFENTENILTAHYAPKISMEKLRDVLTIRNQKQSGKQAALINGFNIQFGDREPIQNKQEIEEDKYFSPASSLLALAIHEMYGEKAEGLGGGILKGRPPKLPFFRKYKRDTETASYQFARNPVAEDYGIPEQEMLRIFTVREGYEGNFLNVCFTLSQLENQIPKSIQEGISHIQILDDPDLSAMSLLQSLDSLGVLQDVRYKSLTHALRDVVMKRYPTYKELRSTFSYAVIDKAPFWVDGEIKRASAGKKSNNSGELLQDAVFDTEGITTVHLPSVDPWNAQVRSMDALRHQVETSTPVNIVKDQLITESVRTQGEISKPRLRRNVRHEVANVALAKTDLLKTKKDTYQQYKNLYARELRFLGEKKELDQDILEAVVRELAKAAQDRLDLSMKTRGWLQKYANEDDLDILTSTAYPIPYDKVALSPLFSWIAALRDPQARESLRVALLNQPSEFTLLYKLMTTSFIHDTLKEDEENFLFTPAYTYSQAEIEKAQDFFNEVCVIFERSTPTQEDAVKEILAEDYNKLLSDVIDKDRLAKHRKAVFRWLTEPYVLGTRRKHNRGITERPFVLMGVGGVLLGALGGTALVVADAARTRAENGAVQGAQIEKADVPDSISRESLENRQPGMYGTILHLPEDLKIPEDVPYFYIPTYLDDYFYGNLQNNDVSLMENVIFGSVPTDFQPGLNDFVYSPNIVSWKMYPPVGYTITKIFQEGGGRPTLSASGEVTWDEAPAKVTIVATPAEVDTDPFGSGEYDGVTIYKDVKLHPFDFRQKYDYDKAFQFNQELSGDRALQLLHLRMINDLNFLLQSDALNQDSLTQLIVQYTSEYWKYIQEKRFYSLDLNITTDYQTDSDFKYLETIADHPNSGFFCAFAAKSLEDFWASVGINAAYQGLIPTAVNDGELWKDVGHATTRLFLPNGMIAFVDSTPPVKAGLTPQADLDALNWRGPKDKKHSLIEELASVVTTYGIPVAGGSTLLYGLYGVYGWLNERKLTRKFGKFVEMSKNGMQFSDLEQRIIGAITASVALLDYEEPDVFAQNAAYELSLVRDVNIEHYGGLVRWIMDEYVPKDNFPDTPEKILAEIDTLKKDVYQIIQDNWYSNTGGVRDLFSKDEAQEIDHRIQSGMSLDHLTTQIDTALELGLLTFGVETLHLIDKVKKSTTSKSESVDEGLRDELLLQEKVRLANSLTLGTARKSDMKKRNASYLGYLYSVFSYP